MQRLLLGTAQFGKWYGISNRRGKIGKGEARRILDYGNRQGIESIDTAVAYEDSEETLGKVGVKNFQVVTKLPPLKNLSVNVASWVEEQVLGSLLRLNLDSLYGLLLHETNDLRSGVGLHLVAALKELKYKGVVGKIGVSIYDPEELEYVSRAMDLDIVQAPLNLVDRRLQTSGWLSRLKQMGVEVHTRSAFLQGLLLMPRDKIPARFERWSYLWDKWAWDLAESDVSPVEACLGYPLSHPEVDRVVVGVDSLSQLKQLLHIASKDPGRESWDFMALADEQLINPSRWGDL